MHARAVDAPLWSSIGESSLTSIPTTFSAETDFIADISSVKLTPPASGVPVPGKHDGSRTSRSSVKYTGLFKIFSAIYSSPVKSNLFVVTWFLPHRNSSRSPLLIPN